MALLNYSWSLNSRNNIRRKVFDSSLHLSRLDMSYSSGDMMPSSDVQVRIRSLSKCLFDIFGKRWPPCLFQPSHRKWQSIEGSTTLTKACLMICRFLLSRCLNFWMNPIQAGSESWINKSASHSQKGSPFWSNSIFGIFNPSLEAIALKPTSLFGGLWNLNVVLALKYASCGTMDD